MQPEVGSVTCRECATRIWCSWPSVITHLANRLFKFSLMATSCSALSLDSSASMTLTWRKRKEFSHKRKFGLHAVKLPWVLGGKIHPRNLDSLMTGLPPENCKMFYNFNRIFCWFWWNFCLRFWFVSFIVTSLYPTASNTPWHTRRPFRIKWFCRSIRPHMFHQIERTVISYDSRDLA